MPAPTFAGVRSLWTTRARRCCKPCSHRSSARPPAPLPPPPVLRRPRARLRNLPFLTPRRRTPWSGSGRLARPAGRGEGERLRLRPHRPCGRSDCGGACPGTVRYRVHVLSRPLAGSPPACSRRPQDDQRHLHLSVLGVALSAPGAVRAMLQDGKPLLSVHRHRAGEAGCRPRIARRMIPLPASAKASLPSLLPPPPPPLVSPGPPRSDCHGSFAHQPVLDAGPAPGRARAFHHQGGHRGLPASGRG